MIHKTRIKWTKICFYVVGILLVFATVLSFIAKQYVTAVCDILWLSFIVIELRYLKLQDEIANENQKLFGFVKCLGKIVNEHGIAYVVPKEDDNDYLVAKEPENINKEEKMNDKIYINNHSGMLESKNYPNTTAYIREDIYMSLAKTLENEQDKNESLRKGIESLQHQVEHYKTLLRTKQDAPHFHDEQTIISKP